MNDSSVRFGPYVVDLIGQRLWRDGERLHIAPKSLAVLLYLIRERPRVVSKDELLDAAWPDTDVGDAVLKVTVRDIRRLLSDDARQPRYVETAHRRGYRFAAPVAYASSLGVVHDELADAANRDSRSTSRGYPLVGRATSLARMEDAIEQAMAGRRQVLFVSGEAGIGKTSVVDAFLSGLERSGRAAVSRGQCVEQATVPEPYLAILDALSRLLKHRHRTEVAAVLKRFAPTWVAQLPGLAAEAGDSLEQDTLGATPGRMLREIAEALEDLTRNLALVLFVDDLHWADEATLDFVGLMARRPEPARFLLIVAYRPSDLRPGSAALKTVRELLSKSLAQEIPLGFLSADDVAAYVDARFDRHAWPDDFTAFVRTRTDGNPLFVTHLLDHLDAQGVIAQQNGQWTLTRPLEDVAGVVPESLRPFIDATLERLPDDQQRVLEAASVCGSDFAAPAVAAALGADGARVEAWLDRLASHGQFIFGAGSDRLPDGTWSPRYAFTHALFQEVLYERVPAVGRMRLHARIAEQGELVYGPAVDRIATELALHFERGAEPRKAITYLRIASSNAVGRFANREAARCLAHALSLTSELEEPDQWQTALVLLDELGHVRRSMGDMPGASEAFLSAAAAADSHDRPGQGVESLILAASALSWFDRSACLAVAGRAEAHAQQLDARFQQHARGYRAYFRLLWDEWRADDVRDCEMPVSPVPANESEDASWFWRDAFARILGADYKRAQHAARESAELARRQGDAFGLLVAQFYRVWSSLLGGDWGEAEQVCDDSLRDAMRNEHRQWQALFQALRAWLLREACDPAGAVTVARDGLAKARVTGFAFGELLAGLQLGLASLECGRFDDARAQLDRLDDRLTHDRLLMDWHWRMPLDLGLASLALGDGRLDDAHTRAARACDTAARSGERNWHALGAMTLADALSAAGAVDASRATMATACELAADGRVPSAALRVWTRASRLATAQGDIEGARRFNGELEHVTDRLVQSFAPDSLLARTLADSRHTRSPHGTVRSGMTR